MKLLNSQKLQYIYFIYFSDLDTEAVVQATFTGFSIIVYDLLYICGIQFNYDGRFFVHIYRGSNSPALFIPRGIGESGNAIFSFLGERGI